jgi:hypothetical protein
VTIQRHGSIFPPVIDSHVGLQKDGVVCFGGVVRLSFPKILSIRIRALRQDPGIIRCDAQSPPAD